MSNFLIMNSLLEKKAIKFCEENKHRLSLPRLEVLKIIGASKKPMKAYEILEKLAEKIANPKPPTAYRAIDFWLKHNFIHRIESLNAYQACSHGHSHAGAQFLICDDCGKVIESNLHEIPEILKKSTDNNAFKPLRWNLEINGLCNQCS